jgi:hypothetical protein
LTNFPSQRCRLLLPHSPASTLVETWIRLPTLDKREDAGRSRLSTQEFPEIILCTFHCHKNNKIEQELSLASMRCFSFQTHLCSCQGSSLNSCESSFLSTRESYGDIQRLERRLESFKNALRTCILSFLNSQRLFPTIQICLDPHSSASLTVPRGLVGWMEVSGLEPLTSCLQSRRSTN